MNELPNNLLISIEGLKEDINEKDKTITELESKLSGIRFYAHAYVLYNLEQQYHESRKDIVDVKFAGGHGYAACLVTTTRDSYYISEEFEAIILVDWWETNK